MTLQQTVSKILKKKVSVRRAQLFAVEEYGVLAAYIRNQAVQEILKYRAEQKTTEEYQETQKIYYYRNKDTHLKKQKELDFKKRRNGTV